MSIESRLPADADPHADEPSGGLRARRKLAMQDAGLRLIREHLDRAVPQMDADAEARAAVEEIAGLLGGRLGFTVRRDAVEDVEVWTSPAGHALVVGAAGAGEVADRIRMLSRARDRLLVAHGQAARRLTVLVVVCGSLVNWRQVEDAAAVRRSQDHVRLIALDSLLSLVEARANGGLAHTDVLVLLRPPSVRADAVVEIVTRGVRRGSDGGQTGVRPGSDQGQTRVGAGTELRPPDRRRGPHEARTRPLSGSDRGQTSV